MGPRYLKIVQGMSISILQYYLPKLQFMYGNLIGRLHGPLRKAILHLVTEFEELERASLLVAADVIYSDDLTDALFSTLERLMSHGVKKVLYLALEKRYNFSLDDLNVVANGYSCFRSYVRDETVDDGGQNELRNGSLCAFVGTRIDLMEIPQYANNYDRGRDLELWKIKYVREEENL